jgi:glycerophosphoryl diester phosphodiesterase
LVKELEPSIEVGFIAGKTLGDITALDVDFLMVSIPLATDALIARATARGMEVHVWSIKEMAVVSVLTDRGVANIITDRPAQVRATLEEIGRLNPLERILLRARNELAD